MSDYVIAAFYQFTDLPGFAEHQAPLNDIGLGQDITGTILLAHEGVNGTIAGSRANIDLMLGAIRALPGCAAMEHKESFAPENPFYRLKVKLKKEIVTMGVPDVNPNHAVGTYVHPEAWNDLISDPDVLVIDTRNNYEVSIGSFEKAENPQTKSFRDFPAWFEANRERINGRKVAMFCTGGIRCEKATSFLKNEGVEEVYHLKGGILKYLETVPPAQSLWQGECFVFDQRVSVREGLEPGFYDMCHACRMPIHDEEKASAEYLPGIACPHCFDDSSEDQKQRFAERQLQIELARKRGDVHMGKVYENTDKTQTGPQTGFADADKPDFSAKELFDQAMGKA